MKNNITIGMDLGDQNHVVVVMDENGKEIEMKTILNTELSLRKFFSPSCFLNRFSTRIRMEKGRRPILILADFSN